MFRPKKYNFSEALQRLRKYCAYQERCHQEVRRKLWDWGFDAEDMDKLSVQLIEEGFLNEERFAKSLAGGKFRQQGWGKRKIEESLKQKGIKGYLLNAAMKEIEPEDYRTKLIDLLEKKSRTLRADPDHIKRQKLARYALGKGYEADLIWEVIEEMSK